MRWYGGAQPMPNGYYPVKGASALEHMAQGTWKNDGAYDGVYAVTGRPDLLAACTWGGGYVFYNLFQLLPGAKLKE